LLYSIVAKVTVSVWIPFMPVSPTTFSQEQRGTNVRTDSSRQKTDAEPPSAA